MTNAWETVIGLEIHAELNTKSKLFSEAPNRFGDEPNTNITEVCTGQPGSLPVLNEEAVKKAIQVGLAIGAKIALFSKFDRKSYFYPDSPRNFQITQYDQPIVLGGEVIAELQGKEVTFQVNRIHLEDDAGMLKHFSNFAGVDYNRAGVPLIEIVSEPCMRSPEEAVAYGTAIKAILEYVGASDCNMEEGSFRMDANISVRLKGETTLRTKTEIKNMNSFSNMAIALDSEIKRQIRVYEEGGKIEQATYRFDPQEKRIVLMRVKEDADDYRYFPEPDLPPIVLTESYIERLKETLPELPLQRERRFVKEFHLSTHTAFLIASDKLLGDYFEEALHYGKNPTLTANWITVEFAGRFKDTGTTLLTSGISAKNLGELVEMIEKGTITGRIAKSVADDMVKHPEKSCIDVVKENPDYQPVSDLTEIEPLVDKVIQENPDSVRDFRAGREKAFAFLVGQVMKLTKGKASPQIVNEIIKRKLII
jgi:aspartyl-tRNA(Asn)/glutamyl-tRNA(Gln) amidotransferase subunit B